MPIILINSIFIFCVLRTGILIIIFFLYGRGSGRLWKRNVPFEYEKLCIHLHWNEKKDPQLKQPKQKDKEHCVEVGFNNEIEIIFFYIFLGSNSRHNHQSMGYIIFYVEVLYYIPLYYYDSMAMFLLACHVSRTTIITLIIF